MLEEKQEEQKGEEKTDTNQEQAETGKKKHERLEQEHFIESKYKEKYKDFRKSMVQKGKHIFDKTRKDKFLGGVKGRRGG
jgi:hypothetical protein